MRGARIAVGIADGEGENLTDDDDLEVDGQRRSGCSETTVVWEMNEMPRLPWRTLPSQTKYCSIDRLAEAELLVELGLGRGCRAEAEDDGGRITGQ